jgi:molecular chaperone Hsp33
MLPESRLYTFLDNENGFSLHFFEGSRLIDILSTIHNLKSDGQTFFSDAVLSCQPIIAFLKPTEGVGIYIDSEDPFFRLKIETNSSGHVRTLLMPEEFNKRPEFINGVCRLSKVFKNGQTPYTSVLNLKEIPFGNVINKILKESYQIKSEVKLSEHGHQSLMIMKLPNLNVDKEQITSRLNSQEYWLNVQSGVLNIFKQNLKEEDLIIKSFEKLNLSYISSKQVEFQCPCSRERMITGLHSLGKQEVDSLFDKEKDSIETRCDYCKSFYLITKKELLEN